MDFLEHRFHIKERGSGIRQELLGGFTMFFAAVYPVFIVADMVASVSDRRKPPLAQQSASSPPCPAC